MLHNSLLSFWIKGAVNGALNYFMRIEMIRLSDKVRLIFAILGASSMLVSMYLIPFIKTENKFWEILLFILGVLLIGIALLNPLKN